MIPQERAQVLEELRKYSTEVRCDEPLWKPRWREHEFTFCVADVERIQALPGHQGWDCCTSSGVRAGVGRADPAKDVEKRLQIVEVVVRVEPFVISVEDDY